MPMFLSLVIFYQLLIIHPAVVRMRKNDGQAEEAEEGN
jgi:hypothetical protein